jgi:hypothetical protein
LHLVLVIKVLGARYHELPVEVVPQPVEVFQLYQVPVLQISAETYKYNLAMPIHRVQVAVYYFKLVKVIAVLVAVFL